jgi:endonuclease YncB( thermonuclease family)
MRLHALIASAVLGVTLAPQPGKTTTVISVGDGDTLRVNDDGRKVTNRLACIDAPDMAQAPY